MRLFSLLLAVIGFYSPVVDAKNSREILFVCTGNYYRSRYAEAVFNHFAKRDRLPWKARSKGLRLGTEHTPPEISPYAVKDLSSRSIEFSNRMPEALFSESGELAFTLGWSAFSER